MSDLINSFDPNMLDVGAAFLAVAFKYAGLFGCIGFIGRAVVRAFSGKERIL